MAPATTTRTRTQLLSRIGILALAATVLTSAGCYYPGGPMHSADRYTYESTPFFPCTVTVIDTRTNERVWTADVPVGQQLVIGFYEDDRPNDVNLSARMDWELMPAGTRYGSLDNTVHVPPAQGRLVEVTKRKSPEQPAPVSADAGKPSGGDM